MGNCAPHTPSPLGGSVWRCGGGLGPTAASAERSALTRLRVRPKSWGVRGKRSRRSARFFEICRTFDTLSQSRIRECGGGRVIFFRAESDPKMRFEGTAHNLIHYSGLRSESMFLCLSYIARTTALGAGIVVAII